VITRTQAVLIAAMTMCLLLVACSSQHEGAPPSTPTQVRVQRLEDVANRGQYGVGVTTLELVDTSRPTEPNREAPGAPDRRMNLEVWYPAAAATEAPEQRDAPLDRSGGPYPLIIFAHGFSSFRRQSASYTQHLASHGYVVASPDFPQSRIDTPGGPRISAVLDQPADVSYVIDEMLKLDAAGDGGFAGAIDEGRIGMTGHSLGGLTTMLAAYGAARDGRIKAIAPISPVGCLLPTDIAAGLSVPAMIIGGSKERIIDPASIRAAYQAASTPRYYAQIIGADHIRFADIDTTDERLGDIVSTASRGDVTGDAIKVAQALDANAAACLERTEESDSLITGERQRELLRIVATPFFDAYLRDDEASMRFLQETLPTLTGIRFESDAGG
jgi:predicted dienelactone hydrolase